MFLRTFALSAAVIFGVSSAALAQGLVIEQPDAEIYVQSPSIEGPYVQDRGSYGYDDEDAVSIYPDADYNTGSDRIRENQYNDATGVNNE